MSFFVLKRSTAADCALTVLAFAFAAAIGASYYKSASQSFGPPSFYQTEFAPAVLLACGRTYENPAPGEIPSLPAFLLTQSSDFDCSDLPPVLTLTPPNSMQQVHQYLMKTVAWYWRATGVSWANLAPIFGVVHGVMGAAAFLLFRLVSSRWLAVPLTVLTVVSPMQLEMLPALRDSVKSPFFVAGAALILFLATRRPDGRALVAAAVGFGVTVGLGIGFRPDIIVLVPAWGLAALVAYPVVSRAGAGRLAVAAGAFVVAFMCAAFPLYGGYSSGSNYGHVALLGFTPEFDGTLGIRPPQYTFAHAYNDGYMHAVIGSYAERVAGEPIPLTLTTPAYERYSLAYLREVVQTFPADVFLRMRSSLLKILDLPFSHDVRFQSLREDLRWLVAASTARQQVLSPLSGAGGLVVVLACALLGYRRPLSALCLALIVVYLGAVSALQFHLRHHFHLEFIGLVALGSVIQALASGLVPVPDATVRSRLRSISARRVAVIAACGFALLVIPVLLLGALRSRQQDRVWSLLASYGARAEPVAWSTVTDPDGGVLIVPERELGEPAGRPGGVLTQYYRLDFSGDCPAVAADVGVMFAPSAEFDPYTRAIPIVRWPRTEDQATRVFVPIYESGRSRFTRTEDYNFLGFRLADDAVDCLSGLSEVKSLHEWPVLLEVSYDPRALSLQTLYQRGIREPLAASERTGRVYVYPPGVSVSTMDVDRLDALNAFGLVSEIATREHGRIVLSGVGESPHHYLVAGPEHDAFEGQVFVMMGELEAGGLTVGLLESGRWEIFMNIDERGPFLAAIAVDKAAAFIPVLANNTRGRQSMHAVVRRAGWVTHD